MTTDISFVNFENSTVGGTDWTCFYTKKSKKTFYFDSYGRQLDKFLPNQLPKPITYHDQKIQDINSRLCGTYCFHFFLSNVKNGLIQKCLKNVPCFMKCR